MLNLFKSQWKLVGGSFKPADCAFFPSNFRAVNQPHLHFCHLHRQRWTDGDPDHLRPGHNFQYLSTFTSIRQDRLTFPGDIHPVFLHQVGRGVGVAVDTQMAAGIVLADVLAHDAAAGLSLAFILHGVFAF
jgi:hypothetical protein